MHATPRRVSLFMCLCLQIHVCNMSLEQDSYRRPTRRPSWIPPTISGCFVQIKLVTICFPSVLVLCGQGSSVGTSNRVTYCETPYPKVSSSENLHGCSAVALLLWQIMRRRDALVCVFEQCVQVNAEACSRSMWARLLSSVLVDVQVCVSRSASQ